MDGTSHGPQHEHLWRAPDGTGLHAPFGEVTRDEDGAACCHLCGRFFRALGSHVRVHGHTSESYRAEMGLPKPVALAAPTLSQSISRRQKDAYESNPRVREWMAIGQELAKSGGLNELAVQANADPDRWTLARREAAAARGRSAQQGRIRRRLDLVQTADRTVNGAEALVARYLAGESLEALARAVGLGRVTVRRLLLEQDTALRQTGHNAPEGRASRAVIADAHLAELLGVGDVAAWLADQHRRGQTLKDLATLTGHSSHWVKWRIARARASEAQQTVG